MTTAGGRALDVFPGYARREAALVLAGAWLAWTTGVTIGGELGDAGSIVIAVVAGVVLVLPGFAAASRCRTLPRHTRGRRARLVAMALLAGAALGLANMAANWMIAESAPELRRLLTERMASLAPTTGIVAAPLVEEVGVRFFLMSAIAWVVLRVTERASLSFAVGLLGSSLFFAALHLLRPIPIDPALTNAYRMALADEIHDGGDPARVDLLAVGTPVLHCLSRRGECGAPGLPVSSVLKWRTCGRGRCRTNSSAAATR